MQCHRSHCPECGWPGGMSPGWERWSGLWGWCRWRRCRKGCLKSCWAVGTVGRRRTVVLLWRRDENLNSKHSFIHWLLGTFLIGLCWMLNFCPLTKKILGLTLFTWSDLIHFLLNMSGNINNNTCVLIFTCTRGSNCWLWASYPHLYTYLLPRVWPPCHPHWQRSRCASPPKAWLSRLPAAAWR